MLGEDLWEANATWWQERYTEGIDPEYSEHVLPMVRHRLAHASRVLDVGSGEGQVTRCIASLGIDAVGIDPVASQIAAARTRGRRSSYARARAERLPFLDSTFDGVVVSMSLEHVEPFEPAVAEIARVLRPRGRLLLFLVHPLLQSPGSGWVQDETSGQHFWRIGSYLSDDVAVDEVEAGVSFEFAHRPLSRYVHTLGKEGLLIDDMVEPVPPLQVLEETAGFPEAADIPRILLISARRMG